MTFLQPNQYGAKRGLIIVALFAVFIIAGGVTAGISLYNTTVNLRHEATSLERNLTGLKLENAELKKELYSRLDEANLVGLGRASGLILDKNPKYLETAGDILAKKL